MGVSQLFYDIIGVVFKDFGWCFMENSVNKKYIIKKKIIKSINNIKLHYYDKREKDINYKHLRVNSIDFLRGILVILTMFIINQGLEDNISKNFKISVWNGMTLADIILPLFVIVMSASIPFFVKKNYENGDIIKTILKRVFIRAIILFTIGIVFSVLFLEPEKVVRLTGPYQLIAINYLICSLIYIGLLNLRMKNNALAYVFVVLGLVLALIFSLIAFGKGIDIEKNTFILVDKSLISGFKSASIADPEGIMACFSSTSLGFIGVSMGCILNKKPIDKKYRHYKRPHKVRTEGFTRQNILIDIKSWLNIKSIKSIYSNYYRMNNEAKKIIHLLVFSIMLFLISLFASIWLPANRNVFSITLVTRISSLAFLLEMILYIFCDILDIRFGVNLIQNIGVNAILIIIVVQAVHRLIHFIKLKSIYTGMWMPFNNWFTTELILPIAGIDYASALYSLLITSIWVMSLNLLEKYKIKINI